MRLFVSIDIPEEIFEYLEEIQSKLPHYGIKKVHDFHLTLKFLGEVDESILNEIIRSLSSVKFHKFKVKISNIGYFPDRSRLDTVWVGVEPLEELNQLQKLVENSLIQFGFENNTLFRAHITLCRIKYLKNKKWFIDKLDNIKLEKKAFEISGFKLLKSTLTSEGPIYEDLHDFKLD